MQESVGPGISLPDLPSTLPALCSGLPCRAFHCSVPSTQLCPRGTPPTRWPARGGDRGATGWGWVSVCRLPQQVLAEQPPGEAALASRPAPSLLGASADWESLQLGGMIIAGLLCVLGLALALSECTGGGEGGSAP